MATTPAARASSAPLGRGPADGEQPALHGVRGLAILLVLIYHVALSVPERYQLSTSWFQPGRIGWCGVDLFFVLSGYLITDILLHTRERARYFEGFYSRRALRIFPLYFLAIAVVAALGVVWRRTDNTHSLLWVVAFLTNVAQAWDLTRDLGLLNHFWSLAVEEHFYLFWPLAVYALRAATLSRLCLALILTATALRTGWVLLDPRHVEPYQLGPWYVLTPLRMDALAAGAWLAIYGRCGPGLDRLRPAARWGAALSASCLGILIAALGGDVGPNAKAMATVGYTLLWLFFACTVVLAVTDARVRRLFSSAPLVLLGRYSYGLYVWHFMVFVILFHSNVGHRIVPGDGAGPALIGTAVAAAATAIAALVSFRVLEAPMLRLKRYFTPG